MNVSAQWNSRDVHVLLSALAPRQFAFATALTLTRLGQRVKSAEQAEMQTALDRPTPFTKNSLYLQRATPTHQEARVWFKDFAPKGTPAGSYLMPQVHGGERKDKRFERALQHKGFLHKGKQLVPASGAPIDAYGNVSRGFATRILSRLQASPDSTQNRTRRLSRRQRARGGTFFYGNPGGRGYGIWQRFNFAFGNTVRPVFLETRRKQRYRPRFRFFAVAERVTGATIQAEFNRAAEQTIRTARR